VDVLVPAATEDVINNNQRFENPGKLIVEGANGPTSSKADNIIYEKGISVVPVLEAITPRRPVTKVILSASKYRHWLHIGRPRCKSPDR